jgi:hypothetical protein
MDYSQNNVEILYGRNYTIPAPKLSFEDTTGVTFSLVNEISGVSIESDGGLTIKATAQDSNFIRPGSHTVRVKATDSNGLDIEKEITLNAKKPTISYPIPSSKNVKIGAISTGDNLNIIDFSGSNTDLTYSLTKLQNDVFNGITIDNSGVLQINTVNSTFPQDGLNNIYNITVKASYGIIFDIETTYQFRIDAVTVTYPQTENTVNLGTITSGSNISMNNFAGNKSDINYSLTISPSDGFDGITIDNSGTLQFNTTSSKKLDNNQGDIASTYNIIIRVSYNNAKLVDDLTYKLNIRTVNLSYNSNEKDVNIATTADSGTLNIINFGGIASDFTYTLDMTPSISTFSGVTINNSGVLQIDTRKTVTTVPQNGLNSTYTVTVTAKYGNLLTRTITYTFTINTLTISYSSLVSNLKVGETGSSGSISTTNFNGSSSDLTYSISSQPNNFNGFSIDNDGVLTINITKDKTVTGNNIANEYDITVTAAYGSIATAQLTYTVNIAEVSVSYGGSSTEVAIGAIISADHELNIENYRGRSDDLTYTLTKSPIDIFDGITVINNNGRLQINTTKSVTVPSTGLDSSYNVTVSVSYGSIFTKTASYKFIPKKPTFTYNIYQSNITYGTPNTDLATATITNFSNISDASFSFVNNHQGVTLDNNGKLSINTRKAVISNPMSQTTTLQIRAQYGNYFNLENTYTLNLLAPSISYSLNPIVMNFGELKSSAVTITNFGDTPSQLDYSIIEVSKELSGITLNPTGTFVIDTSIPLIKTTRTDYVGTHLYKIRALYGNNGNNLFDIDGAFDVSINAVDPSGMVYKYMNNEITSDSPFIASVGQSYNSSSKPKVVFKDTTGGDTLKFSISSIQYNPPPT